MSSSDRSRPPLSQVAILGAARQLMIEGGLPAVSLRRIASNLGVTAPALYAHFESKDALLAAIAEDEFSVLIDRLQGAAAGLDDPIDRIKAQSHAYVDHATSSPAMFQVMTVFRPGWSPQSLAPELAMASKSFEVSSVAVLEAMDSGRFRAADPLMVSLTIWAAVHGVASVLLSRPQLGDDYEAALVGSVIDAVVDGLLAG